MHYIAGAFPSAPAARPTSPCSSRPPRSPAGRSGPSATTSPGCAPATDGRLWAVNPEAGFFGVAPGTSRKTNPNAIDDDPAQHDLHQRRAAARRHAVVGRHDDPPPAEALDWQGRPWTPASTEKAAHPNSRFTAPAAQCPSLLAGVRGPEGVPISAILFGARRSARVPLVYEALDWRHGCFSARRWRRRRPRRPPARSACCGATRWRCGRSAATTWATTSAHWLEVGARSRKPPQIFRVNWFRTGEGGQVPLARLRREPARPEVDPRAVLTVGAGRSRPPSGRCRPSTRSIGRD